MSSYSSGLRQCELMPFRKAPAGRGSPCAKFAYIWASASIAGGVCCLSSVPSLLISARRSSGGRFARRGVVAAPHVLPDPPKPGDPCESGALRTAQTVAVIGHEHGAGFGDVWPRQRNPPYTNRGGKVPKQKGSNCLNLLLYSRHPHTKRLSIEYGAIRSRFVPPQGGAK